MSAVRQFELKAMLRDVFNVNASFVAIMKPRMFKMLIVYFFQGKIMLDEEHLEKVRKLFACFPSRAIDSMTAKRYAVIMNVNLQSADFVGSIHDIMDIASLLLFTYKALYNHGAITERMENCFNACQASIITEQIYRRVVDTFKSFNDVYNETFKTLVEDNDYFSYIPEYHICCSDENCCLANKK
jgi:hypothetical protein